MINRRALLLSLPIALTLRPAAKSMASSGNAAGAALQGSTLTVFAASSLTEGLTELATRWQRTSRQPLNLSFAASSLLARQIEQGARADIFASADVEWMDYLQSRGLVRPASRRNVLGNRLVLIAPTAASRESEALAAAPAPPGPAAAASATVVATAIRTRLPAGARLALADPEYVPAGRYARAALEHLRLWPELASRLARADNTRAALALVARGEAPLGIVYATDARAEPGVRVIAGFDPAWHPAIVYPFALTHTAAPGAAAALEFLTGRAALDVYLGLGFAPPPATAQSAP